jgi:hypothetical protein
MTCSMGSMLPAFVQRVRTIYSRAAHSSFAIAVGEFWQGYLAGPPGC